MTPLARPATAILCWPILTLCLVTAAWAAPNITINKDSKAVGPKDPSTSPHLPQVVDGEGFVYAIFGASFNGAATAPLTVTDTVPEGFEVVSAEAHYVGGEENVAFGTIAGRSVTYTFPVGTMTYELLIYVRPVLGNTQTATRTNQARLDGGGDPATPKTSNTSSISIQRRLPDFQVTKSCAPEIFGFCNLVDNDFGEFFLRFYDKNQVGALSEIVITGDVSPDLFIVKVSPNCTINGQTVTCRWPQGTQAGEARIIVTPFAFGDWDNEFEFSAGQHKSAELDRASAAPQSSNKVSGKVSPPQSNPVAVTGPIQVAVGAPATFQLKLTGGATAVGPIRWVDPAVNAEFLATGPNLTRTFAEPGSHVFYDIAIVHRSGTSDVGFMTAYTLNVTPAAAGCHSNANTLCLQGGRFRVQVDWQAINNQTNGVGVARPISSDTGSFSFFNPANQELVVKVLDGRGLNHAFWVFAGALTNVQFELKVTDTQTGVVKTYLNPQDTQASFADTNAFPIPASAASVDESADVSADLSNLDLEQSLGSGPGSAAVNGDELSDGLSERGTACATAGSNLCLSGRFRVNVRWLANRQQGVGTAVSLTADSGYFWFFNSANVELISKIVDGRGLNGKFWFFYGALSDVAYMITVTDTQTGKVEHYYNFQGVLASVGDTSAF